MLPSIKITRYSFNAQKLCDVKAKCYRPPATFIHYENSLEWAQPFLKFCICSERNTSYHYCSFYNDVSISIRRISIHFAVYRLWPLDERYSRFNVANCFSFEFNWNFMLKCACLAQTGRLLDLFKNRDWFLYYMFSMQRLYQTPNSHQ